MSAAMMSGLLPFLVGGVGIATYFSIKQRRQRFPTVRKVVGETLALLPTPVRTVLGETWKCYGSCVDWIDKSLAKAEQDLGDLQTVVFDEIEYGLDLKARPKPPEPDTTLAMCNFCAGTGSVLGGPCPQCGGDKFRRMAKGTVCPECNGGGRKMCKECFGSGYTKCSCGGTGQVTLPPPASPAPETPVPEPPATPPVAPPAAPELKCATCNDVGRIADDIPCPSCSTPPPPPTEPRRPYRKPRPRSSW